MDKGREADLEMYEEELREAKTPAERRQIMETTKAIVNESRQVRDMRRVLINDMRRGRSKNVRDTSEFALSHKGFRNE